MLRLEFWHNSQQIWFFQHEAFTLAKRVELALRIIFRPKNISIHTQGDAIRKVDGQEHET